MRARSATRSLSSAPCSACSTRASAPRAAAKSWTAGRGGVGGGARGRQQPAQRGQRGRPLERARLREEAFVQRRRERGQRRIGLAGARARRRRAWRKTGRWSRRDRRASARRDSTTASISASSARSTLLSTPSTRLPAPCASSSAAFSVAFAACPIANTQTIASASCRKSRVTRSCSGEDRVQPRRVDDLDAAERLDREEDLDHPDRARLVGAQLGQEARDVRGGERARPAVVARRPARRARRRSEGR